MTRLRRNGLRARRGSLWLLLGLALLSSARPVRAATLADVFRNQLAGLELEPLGPALASTVAATYPVASASSSVTYRFNPATETFERQTRVLGPVIGERAETIGSGQISIGISYSLVDLSTINGHDLGNLVNQPSIGGRVISFAVPGGVLLGDGRYANFLPVYVRANIAVEAEVGTPSLTWGLTPDLDVNLTVPLVRTMLDVKVSEDVPDPRLPEFRLRDCRPDAPLGDLSRCAVNEIRPTHIDRQASSHAAGVGDVLLRAKYVVLRHSIVDAAVGLGVSFPSGDENNFQGSGAYQVQPELILSRVIAERFEPLFNASVDINANTVDRSVVRWAAGATAYLVGPLSGAAVVLGRHELSAQSDKIPVPFFLQIQRNDMYDASFGVRLLFAESGVLSASASVPLNRDGLRADVIPTLAIEYALPPAW